MPYRHMGASAVEIKGETHSRALKLWNIYSYKANDYPVNSHRVDWPINEIDLVHGAVTTAANGRNGGGVCHNESVMPQKLGAVDSSVPGSRDMK